MSGIKGCKNCAVKKNCPNFGEFPNAGRFCNDYINEDDVESICSQWLTCDFRPEEICDVETEKFCALAKQNSVI